MEQDLQELEDLANEQADDEVEDPQQRAAQTAIVEASGPVNKDGYRQMGFADDKHDESSEEQRDSILQPKENTLTPSTRVAVRKKLSSVQQFGEHSFVDDGNRSEIAQETTQNGIPKCHLTISMQPMSEISENIAEASPETIKTKKQNSTTSKDNLVDASLALQTSNRPPRVIKRTSNLENGISSVQIEDSIAFTPGQPAISESMASVSRQMRPQRIHTSEPFNLIDRRNNDLNMLTQSMVSSSSDAKRLASLMEGSLVASRKLKKQVKKSIKRHDQAGDEYNIEDKIKSTAHYNPIGCLVATVVANDSFVMQSSRRHSQLSKRSQRTLNRQKSAQQSMHSSIKGSELGDDVNSLFEKVSRRGTMREPKTSALGSSTKFRVLSKKIPMVIEHQQPLSSQMVSSDHKSQDTVQLSRIDALVAGGSAVEIRSHNASVQSSPDRNDDQVKLFAKQNLMMSLKKQISEQNVIAGQDKLDCGKPMIFPNSLEKENDDDKVVKDNERKVKLEQDEPEKEQNEDDDGSHLPPGMFEQKIIVRLVYALFLANLFFNVDMGILPAGSTAIKKELNLDNAQFGSLGSVVYFGQTLGAALSSLVLRSCNTKYVLVVCITLNIISLIVFTLTTMFPVLMVCRMLTGVFQIFFGIYQPVWADVYGSKRQKETWLTYLLIATPLGVITGYGLCAGLQSNIGWKWSFYIQACLLVPSFLSLICIDSKYMDVQGTAEILVQREKQKALQEINYALIEEANKEEMILSESDEVDFDRQLSNPVSPPQDQQNHHRTGSNLQNAQIIEELPFEDDEREGGAAQNNMAATGQLAQQVDTVVYESARSREQNSAEGSDSGENKEENRKLTYCETVKALICNVNYVLLNLGLCGLYYIVTGITYWVTDYLIVELSLPPQTVQITFGIISLTGPVAGIVVGGNVAACLGGFRSKRSLYLSVAIALSCLGSAAPIPFLSNFPAISALIWFLLFFGGSLLPFITGVMLEIVQKDMLATANSLANLNYNLLGYLPAPVIFGAIYDSGPGKQGRMAMGALMFSTAIPVATLALSAFCIVKNDTLGYIQQEEEEQQEKLSREQQKKIDEESVSKKTKIAPEVEMQGLESKPTLK